MGLLWSKWVIFGFFAEGLAPRRSPHKVLAPLCIPQRILVTSIVGFGRRQSCGYASLARKQALWG